MVVATLADILNDLYILLWSPFIYQSNVAKPLANAPKFCKTP